MRDIKVCSLLPLELFCKSIKSVTINVTADRRKCCVDGGQTILCVCMLSNIVHNKVHISLVISILLLSPNVDLPSPVFAIRYITSTKDLGPPMSNVRDNSLHTTSVLVVELDAKDVKKRKAEAKKEFKILFPCTLVSVPLSIS